VRNTIVQPRCDSGAGGMLPAHATVVVYRFRLATREAEVQGRRLEEQLRRIEGQVPAARSKLEQQQRTTRDQQQEERDRIHAQLQEEAHRRQVRLHCAV
jgi:TolA-binding protein